MKWSIDRFDRYFGQVNRDISENERSILIKEYELCANSIETQKENLFKLTNLIIPILTAIIPSLYFLKKEINNSKAEFLIPLLILQILFYFFLIVHFTEQNKRIFYSSEKLVIIRRVLGLNFDYFNPIIPNFGIEGARNPFELKIFPSWLDLTNLPILLITTIGTLTTFLFLNEITSLLIATGGSVIFLLLALLVSRKIALDHYENLDLVFFKWLFNNLLNIRLETNFGWPLYRAWMNVNEIKRLKIDQKNIKKFLLFIEDRKFNNHCGISLKSIFRASKNRFFKNGMKSGASTITQQVIRSLFIIEYNKTIRRKLVEITLSVFWIEKLYKKDEILDLYLSSVRFEKGVYGLSEALKYFLNKNKNCTPTNAECFFLVERIANTKSCLLSSRINTLLKQAYDQKILNKDQILEVCHIYLDSINKGKIICTEDELIAWKSKISGIFSLHL